MTTDKENKQASSEDDLLNSLEPESPDTVLDALGTLVDTKPLTEAEYEAAKDEEIYETAMNSALKNNAEKQAENFRKAEIKAKKQADKKVKQQEKNDRKAEIKTRKQAEKKAKKQAKKDKKASMKVKKKMEKQEKKDKKAKNKI